MSGAVLVAIVASIGNLLQGWDNATIAAAVLYIKKEFQLQNEPTVEGLIVSMSLIGATIVTTFSGPLSDSIGRRPMLILSSILYFFSGLIMLWSPNVYVLLLARFVDGFGIGLAVTLVPLYISEIAPSEIRGLLNTLPQFSGSGGMFLSYCMVFGMSLSPSPDWRIMLGVLAIPSLFFFGLTIFYLPESPRWLVSKGRMAEAKKVLQKLRGKDDVSGELSLLLEGLEVGGDTSIEEYIIGPATEAADDLVTDGDKEQITLYGPEEGQSWIARPSKGPSMLGSAEGKDIVHHGHRGSALSMRRQSLLGEGGDGVSSTDIGGGWQLAWKWSEKEGENGRKEGGFKRVYLHQEGVPGSRRGSIVSLPGGGDVLEGSEFVHAAALVSQSALFSKGLAEPRMSDAAMVHPSEVAAKGSRWKDLFEPGVRRALLVGVGIQILQQFAGINGVLYYTPQILEQAGVAVILSKFGLSSASASILISSLTTLLMLPCIGFAMLLMDLSGRRFLLLGTIPILIASLVILVVSNLIDLGTLAHALLSTVSVIVYFCCFVMGFGPIPNILCAEIFPTRVRGLCIAICAFTFWIGDIIVTYSLPVMLNAIGLAGVFSIYAVVCLISFVFVFLKVPETKGMPLEVITEFFAVGAKQAAAKA
ncbi:Monosaccharide-sensing protein 2 [Zea mays]|uniref:Monosaccharide-sensing protein 2 n=1 Tax=Zea mays TaxID=4577 RepID=A0A1D6H6H4_MAIZE|nr:Monosaccharide-sensing protein 2 [Zea mays]AQK70397.1 Monosaccharide-sensing protein 2 [Zea mays]AQK70402.1 Monosaccharide-sensing protein 2 [Zea mays]